MGGMSGSGCAFDSWAQTFCPSRSSKPSHRMTSSKARSSWSEQNGQERKRKVKKGWGKGVVEMGAEGLGWWVREWRTAVTVSNHQGAQGWHGSRQKKNKRRRRRRGGGQGREAAVDKSPHIPRNTLCLPHYIYSQYRCAARQLLDLSRNSSQDCDSCFALHVNFFN